MKRSKLAKYHKLSLCISIFIIAVVVFSGCTKSGSKSSPNANPSVYVVGYETENGKAISWVDGVKKDLSGLPDEVNSFSIFNGKIYAAGFMNVSKEIIKPSYSVDGSKKELPLKQAKGYEVYGAVEDIIVSDGKVYAHGFEGVYIPNAGVVSGSSVWVDGAEGKSVAKNFDSMGLQVISFAVSNGKDYLLLYNGDINIPNPYLCYLVNEKETRLQGGAEANAKSIVVNNGKVYVAGRYKKAGLNKACYWEDGKLIELPGGTASRATSIAVDGSNIYVSGYYYDGINKACYWINGVKTDLDGGAVSGAVAETDKLPIALANGKVYIAGNIFLNNNKKACYWVDGKRVDLPGGVKAVAIEVY